MSMHTPPHPWEFIKEVYLEPFNLSYRSVALKLKVSPSTFLRLIKGQRWLSAWPHKHAANELCVNPIMDH